MQKIKEFYLKNKSLLIIIVSAALILMAIAELYFVVAVRVQSNDECWWQPKQITKDSSAIFFDMVKVGGVTWDAGIRNGDQLLEINNKPLPNTFAAQFILDKVKAGDYANYTIIKDGKIVHTKVYIKKLIQIGSIANVILALMQMLIGFIVLIAKPSGKAQQLFYGIGVSLVLGTSIFFLSITSIPEVIRQSPISFVLIALFWSFGVAISPFLFLAFFWIFPKPFKLIEKKWVIRTLIIVPILLALTNFLSVLFILGLSWGQQSYFSTLRNYLDSFTLFIEFIALVSLFINYFRLKTKEEKKPVLIILIAFALAIAAVIYTERIAPIISDTVFNSPQYYTPIVLIIIIPIAFAYSIFKYQLMDVSVVIKNTMMYGFATISIAAIYFFVIYILGQSISVAIGTQFQTAIAGLIFIVFALVFQSTKDKFQDFLTARFYPEQFAYQKVLIKFSNDVSTVVGTENILSSMKETFVESLMLNNFGILIKEKKSDKFKLVKSVGIKNSGLNLDGMLIDDFISDKSLSSTQPVIEREDFTKVFPSEVLNLTDENIYTIIPMVIKSKAIGLLLFGLKRSGSQFAGKDIELLYAAANQSAIAIENARLYQSEAEKFKMERDLDLARKIQQGLLPTTIPVIKGLDIAGEMIPAMQVGGDYFDLLPVSESKLFVVVGDVSGKGLAASLYMAKLQTMVQLSCNNTKSPKEILIELNRHFYKSIERNSFVTMTLALFDNQAKILKFCRAGHLPLLMASNGSVSSFRTQGIGVGLEKGNIFESTLIEEEIALKPGQNFAFFSDGITEAMNGNNDLFGEEKLQKILKNNTSANSNEIMNEIWNAVKKFRGTAEQNDDMTMVLVKVADEIQHRI